MNGGAAPAVLVLLVVLGACTAPDTAPRPDAPRSVLLEAVDGPPREDVPSAFGSPGWDRR